MALKALCYLNHYLYLCMMSRHLIYSTVTFQGMSLGSNLKGAFVALLRGKAMDTTASTTSNGGYTGQFWVELQVSRMGHASVLEEVSGQ